MVKHVTRWSPDTCGCVLEYEWDDAVPDKDRVHTFKNLVKACPEHILSVDKYSTVLDENQRKNKVFELATVIISTLLPDDYVWSWGPGRKLLVQFAKLNNPQKSNLQSQANTIFGINKVQVL